jgi:hypothetical protein
MAEQLTDWPRAYYREPGGRPLLFYAVYGAFTELPALDREAYHSAGVVPGLELSRYARVKYPDVVGGFCQGYLWDHLRGQRPALARAAGGANECLILKGELEDQRNLNYLRDSVGLLMFLLDHGGVAVFDPQMFHWWEPERWKERLFRPGAAGPRHHVVILASEEDEDPSLTWFHTRGMRKFGRPDLSVHRVPARYRDAVIDLCERFIEFQAFGGIIGEGQELRMQTLPRGMMCRRAGDPDDPDFNNVHVEISPPAGEG